MKKAMLLLIPLLLLTLLYGCTPSVESETTTMAAAITSRIHLSQISKEDLNIEYQGIAINDSIDFAGIAEKLEFDLNAWYDDGQYIAACRSNIPNDSDLYVYYRAKYPNKETADLELAFWHNNTKNKFMSLVSVRFLSDSLKTSRGISVGDDESALRSAYGDTIQLWDLGDEVYYETDVEKAREYYMIFTINPTSRRIASISINYNSNKVMDELGIDGFD